MEVRVPTKTHVLDHWRTTSLVGVSPGRALWRFVFILSDTKHAASPCTTHLALSTEMTLAVSLEDHVLEYIWQSRQPTNVSYYFASSALMLLIQATYLLGPL